MDPEGMSDREWHQVMGAMEAVGPYYGPIHWPITICMVDR